MKSPTPLTYLVAAACCTALVGISPASALNTPAPSAAHDVTDPVEAARMDKVPVPTIAWTACGEAQCAKVAVPLSYDNPTGPTTTISVIRYPARKPAERIGILALNPGGPGDSAVEFVRQTTAMQVAVLRDRFDQVGIEPRGLGESERVRCFTSNDEEKKIGGAFRALLNPSAADIPRKQELAIKYAKACMANGKTLATSMNTTNHARDMELMRRAMGEAKMNFFGMSYGTAISQFYANMYPERVRAIVSDGVIDATSYVGSPNDPKTPEDRMLSSVGAKAALDEVLRRCSIAASKCKFYQADMTGPAKMAALEKRIIAKPIPNVPMAGTKKTVTYEELYTHLTALAYSPMGASMMIDEFLQRLWTLSTPALTRGQEVSALKGLAELDHRYLEDRNRNRWRQAVNYDNIWDANLGVLCGDGFNPATVADYAKSAEASKATRAGFGPFRVWNESPCHSENWTAIDPTRYVGPFTKRTAVPMLFMGNDFDPATPGFQALSAAATSPGAGVVTSDGWGHMALSTSKCVQQVFMDYLLELKVPAAPLRCKTDVPGIGAGL